MAGIVCTASICSKACRSLARSICETSSRCSRRLRQRLRMRVFVSKSNKSSRLAIPPAMSNQSRSILITCGLSCPSSTRRASVKNPRNAAASPFPGQPAGRPENPGRRISRGTRGGLSRLIPALVSRDQGLVHGTVVSACVAVGRRVPLWQGKEKALAESLLA